MIGSPVRAGFVPSSSRRVAGRMSRRQRAALQAASTGAATARSAASRSTSRPSPVSALTKTRGTRAPPGELDHVDEHARTLRSPRAGRACCRPGSAARRSAPISASTRCDLGASARRAAGWRASTTCSSRSASAASCSVAWKASTSLCGRSRMKPTVSDSDDRALRRRRGRAGASSCRASRTAGRRRRRAALTSALNSVDLPALV